VTQNTMRRRLEWAILSCSTFNLWIDRTEAKMSSYIGMDPSRGTASAENITLLIMGLLIFDV